MRRGRFLEELRQRQDIYMAWLIDEGKMPEGKFYVQHVKFSLQVDEATYKTQYFYNEDFRELLNGISTALGVGIRCSVSEIAIVVAFPNRGFWCYKSFYGEMLKTVERRLVFMMGKSVPINRRKTPKSINMIIFDDIEF